MYLVNEGSQLEPVKRVYKTREKSQSLLDHPRIYVTISDIFGLVKLKVGNSDFNIFLHF